jgi:hypothetical protein
MFEYEGEHSWVFPTNESPVDVYAVADAINQLQQVLPLGCVGDYPVFCLDTNILVGSTPDTGVAEAQATRTYISLSAGDSWRMTDLFSHEISHRLEKMLTDAERAEFWRIVGQVPNYNAWDWAEDADERFAEYFSAGVWGVPVLNRDMPKLDATTLANIKTWSLKRFGGGERAEVVVDKEVVMRVGDKNVTINGKTFTYDVAPLIIDPPGRVMVPVRLISEAFGCNVTWDEATQTVTITEG